MTASLFLQSSSWIPDAPVFVYCQVSIIVMRWIALPIGTTWYSLIGFVGMCAYICLASVVASWFDLNEILRLAITFLFMESLYAYSKHRFFLKSAEIFFSSFIAFSIILYFLDYSYSFYVVPFDGFLITKQELLGVRFLGIPRMALGFNPKSAIVAYWAAFVFSLSRLSTIELKASKTKYWLRLSIMLLSLTCVIFTQTATSIILLILLISMYLFPYTNALKRKKQGFTSLIVDLKFKHYFICFFLFLTALYLLWDFGSVRLIIVEFFGRNLDNILNFALDHPFGIGIGRIDQQITGWVNSAHDMSLLFRLYIDLGFIGVILLLVFLCSSSTFRGTALYFFILSIGVGHLSEIWVFGFYFLAILAARNMGSKST